MSKKMSNGLLLCVEIGLLLLVTPKVFWRVYWLIGPIERYTRQTSFLIAGVIFTISIAGVVFMLKSRLIKSAYINVVAAWVILMLAALAMYCLCVPYMMGFP